MVIRWVHPKKVDRSGRLTPMAFPVEELRELNNTGEAPSLVIADGLNTPGRRKNAYRKVCWFCGAHGEEAACWKDSAGCDKDCGKVTYGARAAVSAKVRLRRAIVKTRDAGSFNWDYEMAESKSNPGHALLSTAPPVRIARDAPKSFFFELQSSLIELFDSVQPVDKLFERLSGSGK